MKENDKSIAAPVAAQPVTYGLTASIMKLSVERYQRMIESGILDDEDKIELLEGYLVLQIARTPRHDCTLQRGYDVLYRLQPPGWGVRTRLTVRLPDSQPEPDFSLVRKDGRSYLDRHPGPADIGLLIAVADNSLQRDRMDKARIYARAGIPAYWVVNLVQRRVEVFMQPSGPTAAPAYASHQVFQPGDTLPLVLDGATITVPVAALLP